VGGYLVLQIRWHGHACFEITNDVTIVTDPHDGKSIGIPAPSVLADIILVSHDHYDHNSIKTVQKETSVVVTSEKKRTIANITIEGFPSFHDESRGQKRGKNIIFHFTMEDISFCHLGDLGHLLDQETIKRIGPIDILFIPIGGTFTIDAQQAWEVIKTLQPNIVVPMHYKIGGLSLPIAPIDPFLDQNEYRVLKVGNEIDIEKEDLPTEPEVWTFTL
jgi:L-ascorbate metabolism protein UlaG (beta-lactamase superfamily)